MAEKANYNPEPQAAGPPGYEHPPPQQTQPGPEIQLQPVPAAAPGPWNPNAQMQQPQQYAPAFAPQPSQYPTAIPLHALERTSQPVDCPHCHQREMTRVLAVNGKTTHGWAAVLCCCACVGCIPYFMAAFKDVNHNCGKCGQLLATYHGSGHIVVKQEQAAAAAQRAAK